MSFRAVTSILRSAWRRPKQPLVQLPHDSVKLYERTPPPWARWALVLVSVDVMVATSAVDVIWNAWTMPDPNPKAPQEGKADAKILPPAFVPIPPDSNKWSTLQIIPPGHILVPAWKRALSGSVFIISGIIAAAAILAMRSRVVRSISYAARRSTTTTTPGVQPLNMIYIQTASHPMRRGYSYAVRDCWLSPSNENRLMLEVRDQGKWVVDMRGARIADRPVVVDKTLARSVMLKTWRDVEGSTRPVS